MPPPATPETLSKRGFAELVGVTPARISQLIDRGLPLTASGRVPVADGRRWLAANVDSNRRRFATADDDAPTLSPRRTRDEAEAQIAVLKAELLADRLIDRAATLAAIEGAARLERDQWIAWCGPASDALAAITGTDPGPIRAELDRLVRSHLRTLATAPEASR